MEFPTYEEWLKGNYGKWAIRRFLESANSPTHNKMAWAIDPAYVYMWAKRNAEQIAREKL
mgnify:CR=1 FL=1